MQTDIRGNLCSGSLVRWLQKRVTQAIGQNEVGLEAPGVLPVELCFVITEMPGHGLTFGQRRECLCKVVVGAD